MGRVIKISESDIVKISKLIYESEIDLRQYDDEDFIEIFILNFRRWLIDNYGNETKNYPLSYVVNRYLSDYCKSIKDFNDDCLSSSRYYYSPKNEMIKVGQFLAKSGLEKIGKVPLSFKHTERYKKMWETAIKKAKIPSFVSYKLIEETPFNVVFEMEYDFDDFLRSNESFDRRRGIEGIPNNIREFLEKFGGVKFGRLQHGDVNFTNRIIVNNGDMWTDKKFMTKLKKQFKQKPSVADNVHSLKFHFDRYDNKPAIKIAFKYGNWNTRRTTVSSEIRDVLRANGFNIDNIKIED